MKILNMCDPIPEYSPEERLERAKPKDDILMSGNGGNIGHSEKNDLYWDETQGVWLPKFRKIT